MGVKDLWNILSPLCERKPMFELQGKTIAIDMSCWVVDSQTVTDNHVQPKMYLRNLYFRTAFLLMQDILPVFVLEGKAPDLKHNTIAKRNDNRNGARERKTSRKEGRPQFNRILKECKELLNYMGLKCVQGHGEAEAMCAYLNEDGLVHGCISQDSDCFLYGAKVVYRNFCASARGNRGGTGGAVDEYNIDKIEKILDLGRNKMIALALLCGCDYDEGLNGVGKEAAMKLFKIVKDQDIIERIKSWRIDDSLDHKESELLSPNVCSSCGHSGKVQKHTKSGCIDCGTVVKCNNSYKEQRALILNEISLRKKALLVPDFPKQELIDEFLVRKDSVPTKLDIQWKQPQVDKFIDFVERHLCWEPQYAFEKIFPLATRWQLLYLPNISIENRLSIPDLFIPEKIKKIRNIRSVACYEIIWKTDNAVIEKLKEYIALSKDNDASDTEILSELTSIEPQAAAKECYTELVEIFENTRNVKTKKRTAKNKAQNNVDSGGIIKNKATKRRQKKSEKAPISVENNRKIDEFIGKDRCLSLEESFGRMSITPKRSKPLIKEKQEENIRIKRGPQFNKVLQIEKVNSKLNNTLDKMFNELSPDDFVSDNDDHDLNMSEIIDNICKERVFQFDVMEGTDVCKNKRSENFNADSSTKCYETEHTECNAVADESMNEFPSISESYVPLHERIGAFNGSNEFRNIHTKKNDFTLGINDLLNDTDADQAEL
ncbi:flap endonuclease GEN [Osmia bicornis bicornis]|uniref:flap endonuclease GEN n=1 Tax=Osmia bicornis bicornis TaxID=1437191 RepID=UPI001EAEB96E|nr:flap endonuclease GEN [Osmia bicornis bicornis]